MDDSWRFICEVPGFAPLLWWKTIYIYICTIYWYIYRGSINVVQTFRSEAVDARRLPRFLAGFLLAEIATRVGRRLIYVCPKVGKRPFLFYYLACFYVCISSTLFPAHSSYPLNSSLLSRECQQYVRTRDTSFEYDIL